MKEEINNHRLGIKVELDTNEIYPNNPGAGCPVLVVASNGGTASWNCAINECETDNGPLDDDQLEWLNEITPRVEAWMEKHGA